MTSQADHVAALANSCWCADYPASDLPEIPAGFTFVDSWMAPLFEDDARGLGIVVEYLDPSQREDETGKRFTVYRMMPEGETPVDLFESDEWAQIIGFIETRAARAALDAAIARMPPGYSADLCPSRLAQSRAMIARYPSIAAVADRNPVVAAIRAARERLAVDLGHCTLPTGHQISVTGFRMTDAGEPKGRGHVVPFAHGLTTQQAVDLLNAL